jgi:hypothetical protein
VSLAPQTYLSILTFLGLVLGFAGGAVSQLKKTSIDVDGTNEKRLTSFGKLALAISIIGFAGSFSSELLKSAISAEDARASKRDKDEEAKWKIRSTELSSEILTNTKSELETSLATKFAVSEARQKVLTDNLVRETRLYGRLSAVNAPLTSMRIELVVDHAPLDIVSTLRTGEYNAWHTVQHDWPYVRDWIPLTQEQEASAAKSIIDDELLEPFISFLAGDGFFKKEGVLVLGLDNHYSSLLCVGRVEKPDVFEIKDGKSLLPSGISIGTDSPVQRVKTREPEVHIGVVKNAIVLSVDLNVESLDDALLRYSSNLAMNGALPSDIGLFTWSPHHNPPMKDEGASQMPFDTHSFSTFLLNNVDDPHYEMPGGEMVRWMGRQPQSLRHMRLRIVPNNVEQISKTYDMVLFSEGMMDIGGYVRTWHGHAQ